MADPAPSYIADASESTNYDLTQGSYLPMRSAQTLQLLQVNRKRMTFSFFPETTPIRFEVHVNNSSGLIKKPDLVISRENCGLVENVGEGRFEKYGLGTTIKYSDSGKTHDL